MNFSRLARPYTWLTDHPLWAAAMESVAKQLPPSATGLRLLDIGGGAGTSLGTLRRLRPELRALCLDPAAGMLRLGAGRHPGLSFVRGDGRFLPLADESFDAVLMQRLYYFFPDKPTLLAEALRVLRPGGRLILLNPAAGPRPRAALRHWQNPKAALDMALWHSVAGRIQRYTPQAIAADLAAAGYVRLLAEALPGGWIMLGRGEKAHRAESTAARIAVAAGGAEGRSPYAYVLIRQTPNKPAWKLAPGETLAWEAAALPQNAGPAQLLAFSSLPKAVAFMQAAILAGWIRDIHKVAKFRRDRLAAWGLPLQLNPEWEAAAPLPGPIMLPVEAAQAEAPDE
jgi:ubiquinone/menaquinone biosynthesis C-methylase UbiE